MKRKRKENKFIDQQEKHFGLFVVVIDDQSVHRFGLINVKIDFGMMMLMSKTGIIIGEIGC